MTNPIAFLIRPTRLLMVCMVLVGGYGALLHLAEAVKACPSIVDGGEGETYEVSRVELLD